VFADGERTKFAFVRPTVMLGLLEMPKLEGLAADIERTVRAIVDSPAR
jgi:hypothetical protein